MKNEKWKDVDDIIIASKSDKERISQAVKIFWKTHKAKQISGEIHTQTRLQHTNIFLFSFLI